MKESQAMNKLCPMGINNGFCQGSLCMAWEPEHKQETKETVESLDFVMDEGADGWIVTRKDFKKSDDLAPIGFVINWVRYIPLDTGDCGMKSKENGCFYPG